MLQYLSNINKINYNYSFANANKKLNDINNEIKIKTKELNDIKKNLEKAKKELNDLNIVKKPKGAKCSEKGKEYANY